MVLIIGILQIRIDEFNQSLLLFVIVYRRTDHNDAIFGNLACKFQWVFVISLECHSYLAIMSLGQGILTTATGLFSRLSARKINTVGHCAKIIVNGNALPLIICKLLSQSK